MTSRGCTAPAAPCIPPRGPRSLSPGAERPAGAMLALWLLSFGQRLLLWGGLCAVSLAGAILTLHLLRMVASYAWTWQQMRAVPTLEGAYPFLGHALML